MHWAAGILMKGVPQGTQIAKGATNKQDLAQRFKHEDKHSHRRRSGSATCRHGTIGT